MATLDEVVQTTIDNFVRDNVLFTALDVSNKVKEELPFARHREVRDLVRALFTSVIEPAGYAKTPIQVTLDDGSAVEALLYHSLVDSWDLDAKYDDQKRAQKALRPGHIPSPVNLGATVANDGTITITGPTGHSTPVMAPPVPVVTTPAPASFNARVLWDQMFANQPSLFPRK